VLERVETTFGRYTIIRKLAKGGMAEVFLARAVGPMGFEKTVVLKRMLPELAQDEAFVQMFLAEARLAASFTQPHLAQVFDFGQHDGTLFIAMEYVDGPTLRALIRRTRALGFSLPCDVVARIFADACAGLHYVHELKDSVSGRPLQLVHRDISPENVIISQAGVVKVLDFGIVKSSNSDRAYTKSGTVRGKLAYMSPEQVSEEPIDRRSDVWALGLVLFEVLTGQLPYTASKDAAVLKAILLEPFEPLATLRPDAPLKLGGIVSRCLAKDKLARYASMRELQADLEALISAMGPAIGEHEVAEMIRALDEGRRPKEGSATLPGGAAALKVLGDEPPPRGVEDLTTRKKPMPTSGSTEHHTVTGRRQLATLAGLAVALLLGVGFLVYSSDKSPAEPVAPRSRRAVAAVALPDAAAPLPVPASDAAVAEAQPAVVDLVHPATPELVPPSGAAVDGGRSPARPHSEVAQARPVAPPPRRLVHIDFRILPEGEALLKGAAVTRSEVRPGPLEVRFVSKRFGERAVTLQVPEQCDGVFRVGYSFTSDLLTSRCAP
jgi:hypothetical protein